MKVRSRHSGVQLQGIRHVLMFTCALVGTLLLSGCAGTTVLTPANVYQSPLHRQPLGTHHTTLPSPQGLFPYRSAVACPQVLVGYGLARCQ